MVGKVGYKPVNCYPIIKCHLKKRAVFIRQQLDLLSFIKWNTEEQREEKNLGYMQLKMQTL